ncbi:hypothetical protein KUG47_01845 [Falsochrobactrum sp. TDYN1]|uniref:Uncharacterized protein n=1 Tax=Falsochrobactrum tianjinense TaxID=2706015 RepID=A0A949PJV3_9HYPH|nr:hypothetical protein [Falsochrobactrum sp. TDYN1]MBV2142237.1 hypothetical protein [Falsochrobactrum sp. TDYN1]
MTKTSPGDEGSRHLLGRRLLLLTILAILLTGALVWMSIYLFDPNGGLDLGDLGILASEFTIMDTMLPRIL